MCHIISEDISPSWVIAAAQLSNDSQLHLRYATLHTLCGCALPVDLVALRPAICILVLRLGIE